MLVDCRLTFNAKTFVDDVEVANLGAVLDVPTGEASFFSRQIDKQACKDNRDIVRADQAEFEDFVYSIADKVKESNDTVAR